jgi:hypothetical protein
VWRVRFRDSWLYVYVLLEFQSAVDRFVAVRMMTYVGLLYQDLVQRKELVDGRLPPVVPIVLHAGDDAWTAATDVAELIADAPFGLDRWTPHATYLIWTDRSIEIVSGVGLPLIRGLKAADEGGCFDDESF